MARRSYTGGNPDAEEPVLETVRVDDGSTSLSSQEVSVSEAEALLTETGHPDIFEGLESFSATINVYHGPESGFEYKMWVQEHDGPDWGKQDMGETDTSHSASTRTYEGEVPEDSELYRMAKNAENSIF